MNTNFDTVRDQLACRSMIGVVEHYPVLGSTNPSDRATMKSGRNDV